jgi:hypothetical protein
MALSLFATAANGNVRPRLSESRRAADVNCLESAIQLAVVNDGSTLDDRRRAQFKTSQTTSRNCVLHGNSPELCIRSYIVPALPHISYSLRCSATQERSENMSFQANVLKVMIASPEDVEEERKIVTGAIYRWNDSNASVRQLVLLPMKWETHSTPQLGVPAHTIVNRQLLDGADIVIGIFGPRIGTSTEDSIGGTVEEIKKHVAAGKAAKIYFSEAPSPQKRVDQNQYAAVQRFREELDSSGLYSIYESMQQFRDSFEHHLALELNHPRYRWLETPDKSAVAPQLKTPAAAAPPIRTPAAVAPSIRTPAAAAQPIKAPAFDEAHKDHIDDLLRSVSCVQRDLLRFLLQKGGIARVDVVARARTVKNILEMNGLCAPLEQKNLLTRTPDHKYGYSTLAVNERMIEVLPQSLFPRDEDDPPFFEGI